MAKPASDKLQAWLLHSRPFRENSLLLDFLTRERGRFSAIARGTRSAKSGKRALLQPFMALQISVTGRNELQTLKEVEAFAPAIKLRGDALFAAFYMNELLVRLLAGHDAEPELFTHYSVALAALAAGADLELVLRQFELALLDCMGYGVNFLCEAETGEEIEPGGQYYLQPDTGFIRMHGQAQVGSTAHVLVPGTALLAIAGADFSEISTRRHAKLLMRSLLGQHLGDRELASRALFTIAAK